MLYKLAAVLPLLALTQASPIAVAAHDTDAGHHVAARGEPAKPILIFQKAKEDTVTSVTYQHYGANSRPSSTVAWAIPERIGDFKDKDRAELSGLINHAYKENAATWPEYKPGEKDKEGIVIRVAFELHGPGTGEHGFSCSVHPSLSVEGSQKMTYKDFAQVKTQEFNLKDEAWKKAVREAGVKHKWAESVDMLLVGGDGAKDPNVFASCSLIKPSK